MNGLIFRIYPWLRRDGQPDSMKGILASLHCEEALEIERMVNHLGIQPEEEPEADLGDDMEFEETDFDSPDLNTGPLESMAPDQVVPRGEQVC